VGRVSGERLPTSGDLKENTMDKLDQEIDQEGLRQCDTSLASDLSDLARKVVLAQRAIIQDRVDRRIGS
jgi:hypothetical protein